MLYNTFIHIPGIGEKTEKQIWRSGVHSWSQWRSPYPREISPQKAKLISHYLEMYTAEDDGSPSFYAKLMSSHQHWRLFPHFRDQTAYLDIETNGMGHEQCEITTIALYDGRRVRVYVQGQNLADFAADIAEYKVLVTYNGKSFDAPVIENTLHIRLDQLHIDLRHILARLGYKGGLKGCEKMAGINRGDLDGLDGYSAVLLWREFAERGDERALSTLLAYNIADAANLEKLMVHAYNLNIAATPFSLTNHIPAPESPPQNHFPDPDLVAHIRRQRGFLHK